MSELQVLPQTVDEVDVMAEQSPVSSTTPVDKAKVEEDEAYIAFLREVGREATAEARAELRARGIKPVISRNGEIVTLDD